MRRNTRRAPSRRRRKVASRRTSIARGGRSMARRAGSGPVRKGVKRSYRLTGGKRRKRGAPTPKRAMRRTGRVASAARRRTARRMGAGGARRSAFSHGGGHSALHPSNKKLDPRVSAAQEQSRKWVGIELNEEYIEIAHRRLAQKTLFE